MSPNIFRTCYIPELKSDKRNYLPTCCMLRLGMNLPHLPTYCKCREVIDPNGYHLFTCCYWTSHLTKRHDALLRQFMILASTAGVKAQNQISRRFNKLKKMICVARTCCCMVPVTKVSTCTQISQLVIHAQEAMSIKLADTPDTPL